MNVSGLSNGVIKPDKMCHSFLQYVQTPADCVRHPRDLSSLLTAVRVRRLHACSGSINIVIDL